MRVSVAALPVIGSLAVLLAQTACSSDRSALPGLVSPDATPFANRAKAGGSLVYVTDAAKSLIAVFDAKGKRIRTITRGLNYPYGIFVDRRQNLWVANGGDSNVLEYARGGTTPIATLSDGSAYTQDVTICPNGNIYVATLLDGITIYSGPKHRMSGTLEYYGAQYQFVTCDKLGNVFASGVLGTFGNVMEFPDGQEKGARSLPIQSPGNLGAVKPDNAGNILVCNPAGTVTEYTEDGYPTGEQIETNDQSWYDIALSRDGKILLGGDQSTNVGVSVTWPGDKPRVTYRDSFSAVWGVAFDPGQKGI
jgi:hypothetical protein